MTHRHYCTGHAAYWDCKLPQCIATPVRTCGLCMDDSAGIQSRESLRLAALCPCLLSGTALVRPCEAHLRQMLRPIFAAL